jgi:hypothetical protein
MVDDDGEKVKRGVHARWTESSERRTWKLGPMAESWRRDRGRLALGDVDKCVHARKVVKTVLTEVKTMIGPSQGEGTGTW